MSKGKLILLLMAITFFAYFSSFENPFIWDDEQFITSNQYVQQFDLGKILTSNIDAGAGIKSNYFRPLTSMSFAIDAKVWGSNVFGFHFVNTSLHIAAGVFLFLLLLEIGIGEWESFFLSLFFLIHPIQTEAVVYINSRGDSFYAALLFASLFLFQKALSGKRSWKQYLFSGILFTAGIFSKETAAAGLPVFAGFLILYGLKKKHSFKHILSFYKKESMFLGLLVVTIGIYAVLRLTVFNFANTLNFYTAQTDYSRSILIRLLTFARVVWVYIGLLLWPNPLHMERSVDLVRSILSPWVIGLVALIFAVLAIGWWEIRKKKTTYILFGFLMSASLLVPVSGIVPINGILYEHWLYVPMVGFFLILWRIGKIMVEMIHFDRLFSILILSITIIVSIIYSILTIHQNAIWSNQIIFYRYTVSFAPHSVRLHNNLGMSLVDAGRLDDAISEYQKALTLSPDYPQVYNNLGNAYLLEGKYSQAEIYLLQALRLSPQFGTAKSNLLRTYVAEKKFLQAKELVKGNSQLIQAIESVEKQSQQ